MEAVSLCKPVSGRAEPQKMKTATIAFVLALLAFSPTAIAGKPDGAAYLDGELAG